MPRTATHFAQRLGLRLPLVQAPMAGGATTPDLVAAVARAGALGSLAAAYLTPDAVARDAAALRALGVTSYAINLFAPLPVPPRPSAAAVETACAALAPFHAALDLPPPTLPEVVSDPFDALFPAVLDSGATVLSFTFGLLPPEALAAARQRGMLVIGTATSVEEGRLLEEAGVDAVVAQGSEAGGHRGSFFAAGQVGTMALVPAMADALRIPVLAAGGIMDGRGIAAALALGAQAAVMGTAFLTCVESGITDVAKQALRAAQGRETRFTRALSGRLARGVVTPVIAAVDGVPDEAAILPFPWQNALTRPLRAEAAHRAEAFGQALWSGQGVERCRSLSAAALIAALETEMNTVCLAPDLLA